jgi:sugar/nucleoside kinase (ribokinase family)
MRSMDEKEFDVAVVGELNADLILSGDVTPVFNQVDKLVDSASLSLGSSTAIFACGAARLGLRVAFFGKVGEDEFGRFVLRSLEACQVDTQGVIIDNSLPTGLTVILNRGSDRATLTHLGSISALKFEELDLQRVVRSRHLHTGSYFLLDALRPDLPELFREAQQHGLTISLDPNYDPREDWDQGLLDLLPLVDIFLPNRTECCAIARQPDLAAAMEKLAQPAKIVTVKDGQNGACLLSRGEWIRSESIQVEVTDTVGAGDTFDAGFIYGYLQGWGLARCLRLGVVCGALSTRAHGGASAQPSLEEASTYL